MTREWVENGSIVPVSPGQMTGYPPVYYPNELDLATAAPIHVAAGETAQIDLNLRAQPYYRVSIPVMNLPHGTGLNVTVGEGGWVVGIFTGLQSANAEDRRGAAKRHIRRADNFFWRGTKLSCSQD